MINFWLSIFLAHIETVKILLRELPQSDSIMSPDDRERVRIAMNNIETNLMEWGLSESIHAMSDVTNYVHWETSQYSEAIYRLRFLSETLEREANSQRYFKYKREKARLVLAMYFEWRLTLNKFGSARQEIEEGIDCYALEKARPVVPG